MTSDSEGLSNPGMIIEKRAGNIATQLNLWGIERRLYELLRDFIAQCEAEVS